MPSTTISTVSLKGSKSISKGYQELLPKEHFTIIYQKVYKYLADAQKVVL